MSKKTPIKKTKRRLKRTVRRSLAAVLMITAIGVAAIPVPENYAEDGQNGSSSVSTIPVPDAYAYPEGEGLRTIHKPTNLDSADPDNDYPAYIITPLSDGTYQLDWQFKFFLTTVEGNERGIISNYNRTYQQDTVVLNPNVIYQYDKIETTKFDDFYQECSDNGVTYKVNYGPKDTIDAESVDDKFLSEYFKEAYQNYVKEWTTYKKDWQNWNKDPNNTLDTEPQRPSLSRTPADLSDDQKLKYYCDENNSPTNNRESLKGCKLAYVIDSEQSSATNHYLYIPQKITGQNPSGKFDSQGFKYTADSSIIGIGSKAFQDTKNVYYLTVPKEIKYIGTSAFQNSFIKEISFYNVQNISDYAFKNCSQLTNVNMGEGTILIGTEAFYGSGLTSVVFPQSIEEIGPGSFAYCESLQNIDLSKITTAPAKIDEYAFYNAIALNSVNVIKASDKKTTVNIDTIGDGAFAVASGVVGGMTSFMFPTKISKKSDGYIGLGDCVLAGRTNLQTVVMPADYGRANTAEVPKNTFYNCYNLACVEFPDDGSGSCGLASYNPDELFATVGNPDFYVKGPETDSNRSIATPRKTTWNAKTAVAPLDDDGNKKANVPYLYVKNGKNYYEISDGKFLLCIDNKGVLTSCTPVDPTDSAPIDLLIPEKVGNTKVTAIASDCFSDDTMNQRVRTLTIEDNSISIINDGVFKNWKKLEKVFIGNSVTKIGNSAFEGCEKLIDVTFNTPANGYNSFVIGTDAFKTGGPELTFHGDIVEGYAPFEWAMDKDNIINATDGIRVCYKSLSPSYLTVMYDANTGLVTMLDYPKYDQISDVLAEAHSEEITAGHYSSYEKMMEEKYYAAYNGAEYDSYREAFKNAWASASDDAAREAVYASDDFGPWVNPTFCSDSSTWTATGGTGVDTGISDDSTLTTSISNIADLLFEPITSYAAGVEAKAYYEKYPYNVISNAESDSIYRALTEEERGLLDATRNLVVPAGVESIDVYGYINGSEYNKNNARTYLLGKLDDDSYKMYTSLVNKDADDVTKVVPGLFSGYYDDKQEDATKEKYKRGNDRLESVTLNTVEYLPDYAFDSCERLQYVILGPNCKNIGTVPFRGCYSLTTVGDNDYYKTANGIVYSVKEDGSYTIEECLSARGDLVGGSQISMASDENISKVSAIREGAFEECDSISLVDLGDAAGLTEIPKNCFKSCDNLQRLYLPRTVNNIERGAFANDLQLSELEIPGKEVFIAAEAFDAADKGSKVKTTVRTYEDSSARRYAETYAEPYTLEWEKMGDQWRVIFLDLDGQQIGKDIYVENGTVLPKASRPADPVKDGYTFIKWLGTNNKEIDDAITEDTIFVAQYQSNNGMVNGKYVVEFYDGVDGKKIGETQYVEPGGTAIAPTTPAHTGYIFDKWSDTYTNIQSNKSIVALYKTDGTTSGGSTTTSGGSTTTSGSTTSSSKNSSNTSSSTSSSSSNTSSSSNSSNTSGSNSTAGTYTVLVENGSGSGSYAAGSTVIIAANTPADGMTFSKWTTESNGVSLASVSLPATTFVMPANNVTVTANYVAGGNAATAATTGTGNDGSTTGNKGNTVVDITKPGISNRDLATANVSGSTDNFVIKISETDEATQAVVAALTNKYGSLDNILYYAMDITLWDSTGTYQLTGDQVAGLSVDITIPIPDALVAYGGNNMAGAVVNGDQLENLNESFTTINGVPCVRFTATHFSPYTIYVDTGNLTEGMLDVTPKTGDPIHPKWFLSIGLACLSIILFLKKDKRVKVKTA